MPRLSGPMCSLELGDDWIDLGTLALTRSPSPGFTSLLRGTELRLPRAASELPAGSSEPLHALITALDTADIKDAKERAMFVAQIAHESNGFRRLRENLHYSAARLHALFPRKFKTLSDAKKVVAGGADAIAERLYGNRPNLGNTHPGDGARYIGRGFIQLTGRANYEAAGQSLKLDLIGHPDLSENPDIAARIAIWFWQTNNIGVSAKAGDVAETTRLINGGQIGLSDRARRYHAYLKDPLVTGAHSSSKQSTPASIPPTTSLGRLP